MINTNEGINDEVDNMFVFVLYNTANACGFWQLLNHSLLRSALIYCIMKSIFVNTKPLRENLHVMLDP